MPTLLPDWKEILKKAWSVKFSAAALVFGAAEAFVAWLAPDGVTPGVLGTISIVATIGSLVARHLAQAEDTQALAAELAKELKNGQLPK